MVKPVLMRRKHSALQKQEIADPVLKKMGRLTLDSHIHSFPFSYLIVRNIMNGQYFVNLKLSSLALRDRDEDFYILISKMT